MPKVSVIVPVHDKGAYLAECLASIECQTLRNLEIICIDDASTDDSLAICKSFAGQDDRFRIVELPENRGAAAARNTGIEMAAGDFIMFMDADDWYPRNTTIERLYRAAVDNDVLIAGGMMSEYDTKRQKLRENYEDAGHLELYVFDREGVVEYRAWQGDYGYTRFIYSRKLLVDNNITFPPYIRHEDPVFFVRTMLAAGRFYAIPEVVYRYRINHKPTELSPKALDDAIEAIVDLLVLAANEDLPKLKSYAIESLKYYLATQTPEAQEAHREAEAVRQSASYRLGNFFVNPAHNLMEKVRKQR